MNKWSKIERDIIHDSQIRKLIIKHGIKGFGVFVLVRNYVECYDMVSVDALWMQCKGLVRRALFDDVLNLKDLFSIDEDKIVTSVFSPMHARTHMQANMQADKDADKDADRDTDKDTDKDTDRDAAVPFSEREKEREEKKNTTSSMNKFAEEMKREQGQWKEVVCMRSGFCDLLQRRWAEAIDEWCRHCISYAQEVKDYGEARHYFNSFVRHETSGKHLREHLQMLDSLKEDEEVKDDRWE